MSVAVPIAIVKAQASMALKAAKAAASDAYKQTIAQAKQDETKANSDALAIYTAAKAANMTAYHAAVLAASKAKTDAEAKAQTDYNTALGV